MNTKMSTSLRQCSAAFFLVLTACFPLGGPRGLLASGAERAVGYQPSDCSETSPRSLSKLVWATPLTTRRGDEPAVPASPSELIRVGLLASGVEDSTQLTLYTARFDRLCEQLESQLDRALRPPESLAAEVHRFLHEVMLTGQYEAACSRLDRAFDDGDYNCVTATILFHAFCRHVGLQPVAVARRTHVFSRLNEEGLDVETTCADWFNALPTASQAMDGALAKPRSREIGEREIDDQRLVGKIYFNRGVELLDRRDFSAALTLIRASLAWDAEDPSARENLLAGLNNWALAECDAGQFESSAALIDEGLAMDATYQPLRANDLHVRQRWAVDLCERGRFVEARDVLQQGYQRRPEAALFDFGRLAVYRHWARSLLLDGRVDEALAVFSDARQRVGNRPDVAQCEAVTLAECAAELHRAGRATEAARLMQLKNTLSHAN